MSLSGLKVTQIKINPKLFWTSHPFLCYVVSISNIIDTHTIINVHNLKQNGLYATSLSCASPLCGFIQTIYYIFRSAPTLVRRYTNSFPKTPWLTPSSMSTTLTAAPVIGTSAHTSSCALKHRGKGKVLESKTSEYIIYVNCYLPLLVNKVRYCVFRRFKLIKRSKYLVSFICLLWYLPCLLNLAQTKSGF